MPFARLLESLLADPELSDKMFLLAGPRQVGKTTTAKKWLKDGKCERLYYNWDDDGIRRNYRRDPYFFESALRTQGQTARIVFDEIHKIPHWKTLLKGYYDKLGEEFRFLVTGSARLDLFQRSGDSMLGRYHLLHLSPLTPLEVEKRCNEHILLDLSKAKKMLARLETKPCEQTTIDILLAFSGFPAPLLKHSARSLALWQREYKQRLIREDLRDLSRISNVLRVEDLFELLPARVGSPLSLNSLREDLGVSHDSVRAMLAALERLYAVFTVKPYSRRIQHSLKKESKLYFVDWTQVDDAGARFENFMAVQLAAYCDYVKDGGFADLDLFYVRDKQKREVDFLIVKDKSPYLLIEIKWKKNGDTRSLEYFSEQLGGIPYCCVTHESQVFKKSGKLGWVLSANRFFNLLWA